MARYGQRPENALKRATEFIEVGKQARALDTLYEVFKNKKWVFSWSESVLEPIMFKYLELCVELKKSHIAKEGLFQYRNLFQSVNVGSLENVIRYYLRTAEERTEAAREQSQQAVVDIDDLDNLETPESILLSAVSGEDAQDRSDRTILTPWVKFLWESYCQCLELLRTNTHVETLYHDIARMAFAFCLKYNRKTEFRKLCDKLRKHLEDIQKLTPQVANVSISKPETQQLNQDTRLVQLDSAIQMELWQEAYKAIEDIHGLMNLAKKSPVPKTMANYYQKLALVFWKAGHNLFHAAALFKLFQLSKEMKKNITQEELSKMACRVLIATLSIPLPSAHPEFDRFIETDKSPLEKAQRLAVLLGLFQPPTRKSLLRDILRMNVINLATPHLQELHLWLEEEFNPLQLCTKVHSIIEKIRADETATGLVQYIPALQDVTHIRLVRQVSQVYQTIEIPRLVELACFATPFHLERLLVDCVRHNDMQIRIDHRNSCVHFGMDLAQSQREDKAEGPTLQSMPSEQIRNQLINMGSVLCQSVKIIEPLKKKNEKAKAMQTLVQHYHETKVREHRDVLNRRVIIEERKEMLERLNTVREEEEARRLEELARQQAMAEQKRLAQERQERERKRQENELQQIKDRTLKEKMQQISQTSHGQRILQKLQDDDLKKLDADEIAMREVEELQKERRELQQKLKSQEKKVDYYERAKRLEEIPLLEKSFDEKKEQDMKFWEAQEKLRIAQMKEERVLAVQTKQRLAKIMADKEHFVSKLKEERRAEFKAKEEAFKASMAEMRVKLLAERKQQRKDRRRQDWIRAREMEEERLRREEEERLQEIERKRREEEEALEQIRREKEEEEHRERMENLERIAIKQREREREIEERTRAEQAAGRDRDRGGERDTGSKSWRRDERPGDVAPRRPPPDSDSWRSRGQSPPSRGKEEAWRPSGERRIIDRDDRRDDRRGDDRRDDRRGDDRRDDRRDDRDRDRRPPMSRDFPRRAMGDGGSWRSAQPAGEGEPREVPVRRIEINRRDDRDRGDDRGGREAWGRGTDRRDEPRDERRDERRFERRGDDRRADDRGGPGGPRLDWSRGGGASAEAPRRKEEREEKKPAERPERVAPPPPAAEEGDDGSWQRVSRK
ncbi:eukaryotic translation initiation factor 3 subunit A isoform X2 [Neocloeon triangulifer]|uniref:eukaryotic translation initiation factor 3 subunit A isoform X2 n=1 Tax=Neocloeon triangulifer TaxID=2078957 RepID=UPI00286F9552|nr:eukaryotic translation initiation factor 3 subunit A isoform X2 [Neocloeon triangulifer]